MRFFGVVVCLIGLGLTGYSAIVHKAPKIEADIQARVEETLADAAAVPVDVLVDGRSVILRGTVSDNQERGKLLDLAAKVSGGLGPVDELERLSVMAPYRFETTKDENGKVSVKGFAPNDEIQDQLATDARTIFGAEAEIRIDLAAGVPDGDWRRIAGLGMDALATLGQGKLMIADWDVSLVGEVASPDDIEAIDIFADAAPEGINWQNDLSSPATASGPVTVAETTATRQRIDPYIFTIEKNDDGGLNLSGFAPDETTKQAMIDQAKTITQKQSVIANIQIADGMPNADWPNLVFAGIGAMAQVGMGKYEVIGNDASFQGDVTDQGGLTEQKKSDGIEVDADNLKDEVASATTVGRKAGTTENPVDQPPSNSPYVMTIYKTDDGDFRMQGVAPDAATREQLLARLKEEFSLNGIKAEIDLAEGGPGGDWQEFITERATALNVVKSGSLSFTDYSSHLIGVVDTPEDIDVARTKLEAIDSAMTVDLNPIDPRPAAKLELVVLLDKGTTLKGHLPEDLTEKEAASALGLSAYEGDLREDGRGDAESWRKNLVAIGSYLPQFEHIGITLGLDQSRIEGKLHTKSDVNQVRDGLKEAFGADQTAVIDVSIIDSEYENGTRRKNPLNGRAEVYDRGYWLPIVTFSPGLGECRKQSSEILASSKITFLRGEATLDQRGQKILDELAAVVIKCLEGNQLKLEIGGHTDSRGATDMNAALSQERADIVLRALVDRGVDGSSLIATGYGAASPIADNGTDGGRAKNRRITFEWNESGTEG